MRSKLVLLVEDDIVVRTAVATFLEAAGYMVVPVGDGEEALDELRGGLEPALILLDLAMPRKNGEQFRAEQMRDPKLAPIPVVIMSADAGVRAKAAALGVRDSVPKPADPGELLNIAQRYVAGRDVSDAARRA